MRNIYVLLVLCIVLCSCLNRDNLPPYQTEITKNKSGVSMLKAEKTKVVNATKNLKEMSTEVQSLYDEMLTAYTKCLEELKLCCERDDIKRPAYQEALTNFDKKYQQFFSYAKENIKNNELSEDIYPLEIAMKRIYNRYRRGDQKTKVQAIAAIDSYKLPSFDKL